MKVHLGLLLLLGLLAGAVRASIVPTSATIKPADDSWMKKQQKVLGLLSWGRMKAPYEEEFFDWVIQHKASSFKNKEVFDKFMKMYREGLVPREATFSLYSPKAMKETATLFELFYYAKDFDNFYRAAAWARKHVNFVNFIYAFSMAVYNRPDCKGVVIPPLFEIIPNYYIPADALHDAFDAKMHGELIHKVDVNYTGYDKYDHENQYGSVIRKWADGERSEEYRVSYFTEDVSLNELYLRWHIQWPKWIEPTKHGIPAWKRQGEIFYQYHKQLLSRYILERFANCLPTVDVLQWDRPIKTGYNPNIMDMKGNYLFTRPDHVTIRDFFPNGVEYMKRLEHEIANSIDANMYFTSNGTVINSKNIEATDYVGKAIIDTPVNIDGHGTHGSYFFDSLMLLGYAVKTNTDKNFVSGAIGSMLTSARDPAFYSYLHKLIRIFDYYKSKQLKPYSAHELGCHGVKINSMEVSKLTTFFEPFDFDMSYGIGVGPKEDKEKIHYTARQMRLNKKPFSYKLSITRQDSSDSTTNKVMVRIFLGPKYDSDGHLLSLEQARLAYFEMDRFPVQLEEGVNVIERSSEESSVFVQDLISTRTFKDMISKYSKLHPNIKYTQRCGFPANLQLPKGKKSGSPYMMFAIATPYITDEGTSVTDKERYFEAFASCGSERFYDHKPEGFPFDRKIPYEKELHIDNTRFLEVSIFHKDDMDFNHMA